MNELVLLSEESIQALGWALLHSLWQGLAVVAIFGALRVFIKNSNLRYLTGCATLCVMVALPLATFVSQYSTTSTQPTQSLYQSTTALSAEISSTVSPLPETRNFSGATLNMPLRWTDHIMSLQNYIPEIVLCWIVGVLLLSLRLLGGCWASYRFKRTGTHPLPKEWQVRVNDLTKRLGIRHKVKVVVSSISPVPMVVGIFRPVVLVPIATFLGLTRDQLETILIHELAHIRRYDNLVNLLQRSVETVFFFHPAVWWISRCIRTERVPALASAATDGPLLSRIKRLLNADGASNRNELGGFSVINLASILAIVVLAAVVVEETQAKEANTNAVSKEDQAMNIMVDVSPAKPPLANW